MTVVQLQLLWLWTTARYERLEQLKRERAFLSKWDRDWRDQLIGKALFSTWVDLERLRLIDLQELSASAAAGAGGEEIAS